MKWARGLGVVKLELTVFPHNAPAIALYRKLGFREEGILRRRYFIDGRYIDAMLMGLDLDRVEAMSFAEIADSFFKPAVQDLVPVRAREACRGGAARARARAGREARVERGAVRALPGRARGDRAPGAVTLNRYPDGGACRLRTALAELHDVRFEEIAPGAGSDGVVDYLSQLALDPGDEIVCGWPSFPSYVIDALKIGAVPRRVPLRDHRYDLDAMLEAIGPRTKLVYVCHPNNPTGTMSTRAELDTFLDQVPGHVLTVLDQAYYEYIDDPEYVDGLEYLKAGRKVVVLRTFSKIYGLAGLRVGLRGRPGRSS